MCFIDYTFFPILFFLGWNIVTAKQFMPNVYRYGFVRNENKDSSMTFRQTKFDSNNLSNETQTYLNFLDDAPGLFETSLKSPLNDPEKKQNNKSYSYSEIIDPLLNFYRLTGKYKDISYKLPPTHSTSNHNINRGRESRASKKSKSLRVNYVKFKHSQNIQRSFGSKTFLNPISSLYLKKELPSGIFKNWINYYNKFTGISSKIDNDLFKKIELGSGGRRFHCNLYKRLSFFSKKTSTQHKNKTFYFSSHCLNKFNSLVQKSDVFLIKNKIQKRREKRIKFLLRTPIQKIYSLQKFQIPLYFSSAI